MKNGDQVTLCTGRVATVSPRTYNTVTGYVVWLTKAESRSLKLSGYTLERYSFSVDMSGRVERWVNGFGGIIKIIQAPVL